MNLELCLRIAGVLQLGILIASALVPKVLRWRSELSSLDPLARHLIWVHGAYVVLMIVSLGLLCLFEAPALADGTLLARSVTGFIAVFWGGRLAIQFCLFDAKPYLTTRFLRLGYHGLTACFTYLTIVFTLATLGVGD